MRGEFSKHGIDVNSDLSYISIPTYSDHVQALARDQADIVCTTEPYGSQILQMKLGKFFVYPYDQAAGKLTNMVFTRSMSSLINPRR
jgi:ABC-type nitrate/sulfonate/bicarbonate transport system substrate-binding protein